MALTLKVEAKCGVGAANRPSGPPCPIPDPVLAATTIFGFPLVVAALPALADILRILGLSSTIFIAVRRQSKKFNYLPVGFPPCSTEYTQCQVSFGR